MKRVVGLMVVVSLMGLTGCSRATANPIITASETTLPPVTAQIPVMTQGAEGDLPVGFVTNQGIAIIPVPRHILIENYKLGVDRTFVCAYFHNGDGLRTKLSRITTEINETVAAIPINVTLANNGLLDIVSIDSTILKKDEKGEYTIPDKSRSEKLEAIAYDGNTQLLTIMGFLPDTVRIMKLVYKTVSNFKVAYSFPPKTQAGYDYAPLFFEEYVTIEKPAITMKPLETVQIPIRINVPPNCKFDTKKFEFELLVSEVASNSAGTVGVTQAIAQPVLITLK